MPCLGCVQLEWLHSRMCTYIVGNFTLGTLAGVTDVVLRNAYIVWPAVVVMYNAVHRIAPAPNMPPAGRWPATCFVCQARRRVRLGVESAWLHNGAPFDLVARCSLGWSL